jgi:hypothetical protein
MENQSRLDRIHDRWLEPPEPPEPNVVFECDCCGEPVRVGDEYVEFGDGDKLIKEHADELIEDCPDKYDDYTTKIAEVF